MVTQAKWALEAELRNRAKRLTAEASARRAPLAALNGDAAPAAASCGDARGALPVDDVASAGAALDGDVEMRAVQPAAPRIVAASAFGGAAGGDVPPEKPRANLLDGARALDTLDGAEAGGSVDDLRVLPSDRLRAVAAQAPSLVGDGARGGLRGAAPVASLDDDDSTRGAADSAALRGSDVVGMPALRRGGDLLSKTVYDAGAIPETREAQNALNALPLADKPSGRLAGVLVDAKLLAFDEATGTVSGGSLIDDLRKLDEEKRTSKPTRWYIYKILLVAVQMALAAGRLRLQTKQISVFRCVYGRFSIAATLWAAGITMLEAMKMQLPLLWVPLEVRVEDLHLLPSWVRAAFPRGLYFESTDQIKELLQRSNGLFFDCKCWLWNATCAGLVGTLAAVPAFALTAAGFEPGSLVATRGAPRSRAVVRSSAAGGSSDAVSSLFSAGVDYKKIDFSFAAAVPRGSALLSSQPGFPPLAVSVPYFYIRFHKPNTSKLTDWFLIDDFAAVMPQLNRSRWDAVPAWVLSSKTLRALAAGAALIFRGMDIRDVATSPYSLLQVFDPTIECRHNHTYTIWAGVDFVIVLPDGRVLDKRLFLLELLKAHAA